MRRKCNSVMYSPLRVSHQPNIRLDVYQNVEDVWFKMFCGGAEYLQQRYQQLDEFSSLVECWIYSRNKIMTQKYLKIKLVNILNLEIHLYITYILCGGLKMIKFKGKL